MFVLKQVHVAVFDLRSRAFWHFHVRAYVLPARVACCSRGSSRALSSAPEPTCEAPSFEGKASEVR